MNEVLFRNATLFITWCRNHISCDECGLLGARSTRGSQFLCTDCARNYRP
jgi:hypothetical protein